MKSIRANPSGPAPGTQVLRRAHDILRLLALHPLDGMRLIDIAGSLGLHPPTAHRIVQGLVQERMAMQDAALKRYFLGPALHELGLSAAVHYPLREILQSGVERLTQVTGDTVVVTVRSGRDGVCLEHRSGEFPIRASTVSVGVRRPLAAGAGGMAILSCLAPQERAWLVRENAEQLKRDPVELGRVIEETVRLGHALNVYRRTNPPITSIGVPVLGAFGQCVAGMSVVALSLRLSGKRRAEVLALLLAEARLAGERLAELVLPEAFQ